MSRELSFTTALGSHIVRISFENEGSLDLLAKMTDFLIPAAPDATPNFNVYVKTGSEKMFPAQYTVSRSTQQLEFRSPDFVGEFDLGQRCANVLIPNFLDIRDHFKGKSLRPLWSILAGTQQLTMMHAALIAREGEGVLIVGNSGRGKTTLATHAARHGWSLLSEDTTPVSCVGGITHGYSFYASLNLTESEALRQQITISPRLVELERQKRIFHFSDLANTYKFHYGTVPVRTIVALDGFTDRTAVEKLSTTDVLRYIVPSTMLHDSLKSASLLRDVTAIAKTARTFSMRLGPMHTSNVAELNSLVGALST